MRIVVVGVGNIGFRYVQGIRSKFPDAHLILVDQVGRLDQLKKLGLVNTTFVSSIDHVEESIDLCVVATSSEPRLAIYKRCLQLAPRNIILEKYLFKSIAEFEECLSLTRVPTFVNQWLYGSGAFDSLFDGAHRCVVLSGSGWGLACNAVHWMDVFKRHLGITNLQVSENTKINSVFASKRAGYEELSGELVFADKDSDKTFRLIDHVDRHSGPGLEIIVDEEKYSFDYTTIKRGQTVVGRLPFFSELIGSIVGELVETGQCHLPDLEESISQHLLIEAIIGRLDRRPKIT